MTKYPKARVYARKGALYYQLINIVMRGDDSIYIYFPRKNGYKVRSKLNIDLMGQKTRVIEFKRNIHRKILNPYISFHPGKGAVHVQAHTPENKRVKLLRDRSTHTKAYLLSAPEFLPFVTVLIPPNVLNFDAKVEPAKEGSVVFNAPDNLDSALVVEIMVHSQKGYVDKDSLTLGRIQNIIKILNFNNEMEIDKLTYSLIFSVVPVEKTHEATRHVISLIWNKEIPFSFCLTPH